MNHTKITAAVYDQTLTFEELPMLASGGVDEVQIALTFDSLWDGLEKTAVFYRKLGAVYHIPVDESGTVVVPCEVMKTKGCFWFGVFGENEAGTVRTTEVKQVNVVQGAAIENEAGYEPAPDIYAEILAAAKNAESIAQSVRDDADAGKFGGGGSVPSKLPNPYPLSVNGIKYDGTEIVLLSLMRWMGEWTNSNTYYANDVVSYNGNLYVCIANNVPDDDVPSDLISWVYLTKNGETDLSDYYTKAEIDAMFGSYITDIDTLVGGDS